MIKVISAAALIAGMASASFAGSLNTNTTVVEEIPFVAPSSSSNLIIPAVGCLVVCTLLLNDDDDAAPATTTVVTD